MIKGNIKIALNLSRMQIHCENSLRSCLGDQVSDQFSRDRFPSCGFAIGSSISIVGNNGGDLTGGGSTASIDHNQQFHQIIVNGMATGLDEIHISSPNGFLDLDIQFSISKTFS